MLVIGNKTYRNLQEQVGWNTKEIEKVYEYIDEHRAIRVFFAEEDYDPNDLLKVYDLSLIDKEEDDEVKVGDLIIFRNCYFAFVLALTETGYTVKDATSFKGADGAQGPAGADGAQGPAGADGTIVTANPTLDGTEGGLTALQIDLTKYSITKGLYGKFARIMPAPSSINLTAEQKSIISESCIMQGDFQGFHNPVLFAFGAPVYNNVYGIIEGIDSTQGRRFARKGFYIDSNNVFHTTNEWDSFNIYGNTYSYRGKATPAYPNDTTKQYKYVMQIGGALAYVEDTAEVSDTWHSMSFSQFSAYLSGYDASALDLNNFIYEFKYEGSYSSGGEQPVHLVKYFENIRLDKVTERNLSACGGVDLKVANVGGTTRYALNVELPTNYNENNGTLYYKKVKAIV